MALIGCEQCGRTGPPPKIEQKVALPTQEIALFLQGSIRTLLSGQKKEKSFSIFWEKICTLYYYNQVKLEKSSYATGFSTEFEVNLKGRPFFYFWEKIEKRGPFL